ncbi:MAG TPA: hypothetical protein VHW05_11080 [Phenylobacterium sp.]|jgi:hypothetical protein|nr:hypothetical protein [Phenylobacterium sp.]
MWALAFAAVPVLMLAFVIVVSARTKTTKVESVRRGRAQAESLLARRNEELVSFRTSTFGLRRQLSNQAIFLTVGARTAEGDLRTYHWAYDPYGFGDLNPGLLQRTHGVWHNAPMA